jgi:hypothetical protein
MKPVVATFAERTVARVAAALLKARFGLAAGDVSVATTAAYGEPHDGHALLAAWVPDEAEASIRAILVDSGGALQPQPWIPRVVRQDSASVVHPAGNARHS